MPSQSTRRFAAPLAHRIGDDANAAQIAAATFAVWEDIDDALTPIIGPQGVMALYKRTLHLTGSVYPWLAHGRDGARLAIDPMELKSALGQQTDADAAAGGSAFLQTFHELLASLVGRSLTDRLLRSAWTHTSSSDATAQDTST